MGFNGKSCLLRAICEAQQILLNIANGVLGDILHLVLTPSSTKGEIISSDFFDAERNGKHFDCKSYFENCSKSFLDSISNIF